MNKEEPTRKELMDKIDKLLLHTPGMEDIRYVVNTELKSRVTTKYVQQEFSAIDDLLNRTLGQKIWSWLKSWYGWAEPILGWSVIGIVVVASTLVITQFLRGYFL